MKTKHVLFDNDGVLVDTEYIASMVLLKHLEAHGYPLDAKSYFRRFPGLVEAQIVRILVEEEKMQLPPDFGAQVKADIKAQLDIKIPAIRGMVSLFRNLKLPKSMVSNGTERHVLRSLKGIRVHHALDGHIFSVDQVQNPKPAPDLYHLALQTLDLQPNEVIVVEDSPTGIKAAKAAGLRVIGFLGGGHITEGHGEHLLDLGADALAKDAKALGVLLERHY